MNIKIDMVPYKTVYKGSFRGIPFELNIFNYKDYDINWFAEFPDSLYNSKDDIELEIYQHYSYECNK